MNGITGQTSAENWMALMAVKHSYTPILAAARLFPVAAAMRRAFRKKALVLVTLAGFQVGGIFLVAQSDGSAAGYTNRLIAEKSPYLLLHAHNPVDWYPWGAEAFQKASHDHKPIFLSIGYFTCHWCHVMERESFSNPEIADVLNKYFVAIKVDREERPDIDHLYLDYVETITNQLGWPLNVFLTPDQKPFLGDTYLAPDKLKALLLKTAEGWSQENGKLVDRAGHAAHELIDRTNNTHPAKGALDPSVLDKALQGIANAYDRTNGGFGGAPKFSRTVVLDFLLRTYARTGKQQALDMVLATLRAMSLGGIHDQLGGGFHRYAIDSRWRIPHFEKTLSDQAQLALIYCDAYQVTHDPFFAIVGRDILNFSLSELQLSGGGFASALDADSGDGRVGAQIQEGAFYTWTKDEIERKLGPEQAAIFEYRYGVQADRNIPVGQRGSTGNNVLFELHTVDDTARHFGRNPTEISDQLDASRSILREVRFQRVRPLADDKVVTAWNGTMIAALARASRILNDASYLASAESTARFLQLHLYDAHANRLWRSYRSGSTSVPGFLDDYTGLINGLVELYESDFNINWLQWAVGLQQKQDELFWDKSGGYFDAASGDASLFARTRERYDGDTPSPNSVAAMNLLRLSQITGRDDWRDRAHATMMSFSAWLTKNPEVVPSMDSALDFDLAAKRQVVIAGELGAPDTRALLELVNQRFLPNKILLLADEGDGQEQLARWLPFMAGVHRIKGKATAYVCDNYTCKLPTADLSIAAQLLDSKPQ